MQNSREMKRRESGKRLKMIPAHTESLASAGGSYLLARREEQKVYGKLFLRPFLHWGILSLQPRCSCTSTSTYCRQAVLLSATTFMDTTYPGFKQE